MTAHHPRRWLGPAILLAGVLLIGLGVAGIFRVSLSANAGWLAVILPVVEVVAGTVLLFIPLLRRLAHEADKDDNEQ